MFSFDERGNAPLEFLVAAVCLFLPLVSLAVTGSEIQTMQFATAAAARQAAREFTRSPNSAIGLSRARDMARLAFDDFGANTITPNLDIACSGPCFERGTIVTVTVRAAVPLRFLPALPGMGVPGSATVSGNMTARVSRDAVAR